MRSDMHATYEARVEPDRGRIGFELEDARPLRDARADGDAPRDGAAGEDLPARCGSPRDGIA